MAAVPQTVLRNLDNDFEDDSEDEKDDPSERARERWNGRPLPGADLPGEALKFRNLSLQDEYGNIPLDGLTRGKEHVDQMRAAAARRPAFRPRCVGQPWTD